MTAAAIMSVMLILSSFVTTCSSAPRSIKPAGAPAEGRLLSWPTSISAATFGTIYDVSTILILGLAGASAMAGLLHLIPRYLPRFGMAPRWAAHSRPLVLVLFAVDVVITLIFHADVEAQSGAYATGVLVLILSAAVAATLALWRERRRMLAAYTGVLCLMFAYTLADNCLERPDGLIIGAVFTLNPDGLERFKPVSAIGGDARADRLLRRRRELADRSGTPGQEGPSRAHRQFGSRKRDAKSAPKLCGITACGDHSCSST